MGLIDGFLSFAMNIEDTINNLLEKREHKRQYIIFCKICHLKTLHVLRRNKKLHCLTCDRELKLKGGK